MDKQLALAYQAFMSLKKAHETQPAGEKLDTAEAVAQLSTKEAELDEWHREASDAEKTAEINQLNKSLSLAREAIQKMSRVYAERDEAKEQLVREQEVSESTRLQLEEVQEKLNRLQGEHSRLQEKVAQLESEEHQDQIIKDHRSSTLGRLETALACKVGFDYLKAQLLNELRDEPDRLHRPPIIAPHLEFLSNLEGEGEGYDVGENEVKDGTEDEGGSDEGNGMRDDEEMTKEVGESSIGAADKDAGEKRDLLPSFPGPGTAPL